MSKVAITGLNRKNLEDKLSEWGEPRYRAQQILDWVYHKSVADFSTLANIPPALREHLDAEFLYQSLEPIKEIASRDGKTIKILFQLNDEHTIESVLMFYNKRRTVCISSQIGCVFSCPLCATGASGFKRNLTPAEIIDQVLFFSRRLQAAGEAVSNVVFMGMGEPLTNFPAVWNSIETMTSPELLGLGARHITISTSGIVPGIQKLSKKKQQVGLAVSLHASNNKLRNILVPPNRTYPLEMLIPACQDYIEATSRRISFEYVLIKDINDSSRLAAELASLLGGMNCFVNIIPVNPSQKSKFQPPTREKVQSFSDILTRHHINNTVRMKRGTDIDAGCGQLRARLAADRK